MPQLTSLAIDDRETTPVTHTFVPRSLENGVALFVETDGTPIGDSSVTVSMRKSGLDKFKARIVLAVPVVVDETINGVVDPKVARVGYADVTFTFASKSSLQERKNVVGMLADALAADQTFIDSVCTGLEGIY